MGICTACGHQTTDDNQFCGACGAPQNRRDVLDRAVTRPSRLPFRIPGSAPQIVSVILLIVTVLVGGFVLLSHWSAEKARSLAEADLQRQQQQREREEQARAAQPRHFNSDPNDALPVITLPQLQSLVQSANGLERINGTTLRVRATIENNDDGSLSFMSSPEPFLYHWFVFNFYGDPNAERLQKGDAVEFLCSFVTHYRTDSAGSNYASDKYVFQGHEIQKLQ